MRRELRLCFEEMCVFCRICVKLILRRRCVTVSTEARKYNGLAWVSSFGCFCLDDDGGVEMREMERRGREKRRDNVED